VGASSVIRATEAVNISAGSLSLMPVAGGTGGIVGRTVDVQAGNGIFIGAGGNVTGKATSGDGIRLDAGTGSFMNSAGTAALSTAGTARWLVYSADPTRDTVGGLPAAFKQYAATGTTAVQGSGNGLMYALAPVVNVDLQGSVSKTYDGNSVATLTADNFEVSGTVLTGDTVNVSLNSGILTGLYGALPGREAKDAGAGKLVTVNGLLITASESVTNIPVYGYKLGNPDAAVSGSIGTIAKDNNNSGRLSPDLPPLCPGENNGEDDLSATQLLPRESQILLTFTIWFSEGNGSGPATSESHSINP
jgi:hypothetical protein